MAKNLKKYLKSLKLACKFGNNFFEEHIFKNEFNKLCMGS